MICTCATRSDTLGVPHAPSCRWFASYGEIKAARRVAVEPTPPHTFGGAREITPEERAMRDEALPLSDDSERGGERAQYGRCEGCERPFLRLERTYVTEDDCELCWECAQNVPCDSVAQLGASSSSPAPDGEAEGEEFGGRNTAARLHAAPGEIAKAGEWSPNAIKALIRSATEPLERRIEELRWIVDKLQSARLRDMQDIATLARRVEALEKTAIPLAEEPKDTLPPNALKHTRSTGKP